MTIHLDFETRSTTDLTKSGVHRYVEDPNTRPWLFRYSVGDGPRQSWRWGDPPPLDLLCAIEEGMTVTAHHAAFERIVWNGCMVPNYPWAKPLPIEQMRCTMVRALTVALPGKLDTLGQVLKLKTQKDMEGSGLMRRMMKPRKVNEDGSLIWWDEQEKIDRLDEYCDIDVATEAEADTIIPHLEPDELELWFIDQHINDLGVKLDVPLIEKLLAIVDVELKRLDGEIARLTDGRVKKCSESAKIRDWLNDRGIACTSIAKGEQEELLARIPADDDAARKVFELRREAAKATSTAKLKAMLKCVCRDGRARDQFQFNGANTGRWAGRLIQLQNLPRVDEDRDLPVVLQIIDIALGAASAADARDRIELLFGAVMPWISKCMRACIVVEAGKKFVGGDLANIEGRIAAWVCDEHWKTESFRDYDAGRGPDNYKLSYSRSFGIELERVGKSERQIGKVQELALGYQGSIGAYISMAAIYGIRPEDVANAAFAITPIDVWMTTAERYGKPGRPTYDLSEFVWTGIKVVVDAWRKAHPHIIQGWWDLQDAAIEAVAVPGRIVSVLKVHYLCANGFLLCRLPSGKVISYVNPRIGEVDEETGELDAEGKPKTRKKTVVRYDSLDGTTRQWKTFALYGGIQFENIVQATAREVLRKGILRTIAAGYGYPVMTVHDETVSEVDKDFGSAKEYEALLATNDDWNIGLPLAAKAWEDTRYVK